MADQRALQTLSRDAIHAELRRIELLRQFSARELEVLRRLARGQQQPEIRTSMFLSEPTVKRYVASLVSKLGAANSTNAVAIAYEAGLLSPGDARSMEGGSA